MQKNLIFAVLLVLVGAAGAVAYIKIAKKEKVVETQHGGEYCARHDIAESDCPWCDPSLIESKGHCAEHGVPEALCSRCDKALIPGFKAEADWCAGHNVPESQCDPCKAGNLPPGEKQ